MPRIFMADPKLPQRNSSRTIAIVVVVLLIVVAIAGIVLAGRNAPAPTATPAPTTPGTASAPTAAAPAVPEPSAPPPSEIVFAAGSDKVPPQAADGLARFSDMVRTNGSNVRLTARFLTGANKAKDFELAKARTAGIRHALEANGIKAGQLQTELIEMPAGALKAGDGERIELIVR